MRMWMIDPKLLCRNHLLGEHNELHKHRPSFVKKHRMDKRLDKRQIFPYAMESRHEELAIEMLRRGYNHQTPYEMPDISYLDASKIPILLEEDINRNLTELIDCDECKKRR